ncbi:MAG: asparagine synthase (glutamine-hydrolyzing) [Cyanobacteria bacterium SZAS LIN-3]|nr:asparagine synthase (glutamine-hydrolyzing) [Cyanobacteria bacterium SZAS LIN-3]MBS2005577.1 asparagine synthase (glutamine-hydrolyzing) [Cyanobacteria bacterium SZAS TMP-1]
MCGIVGYLNLNGEHLAPKHDHLPAMCDSIAHRGPDEEGMKLVGAAALGMTRLAIIDVSGGQQPITNEDGSIWIVFNGEIYNFQELQERVLGLGHTLVTKSDTETIVHLYEEYGVECLQFLEGMFAFAIYDTKKERLFIARDRMGEKPLHWGVFDGTLIFSSEIKGILSHPKATRALDISAMQKYMALEYVPNPQSMFKDINKLPPAHFMLVEKGQVKVDRYWLPSIKTEDMSEDEAASEVVRLLKRSTELRLISEVPLGVFLSGGIDSSCIAAFAAQLKSDPIKTFSIGFDDPSFDESIHALAVAKHIGSDHEVVTFSPDLAFETLNELWGILDEPLADASIVPTYFLSKMTRRHVTVALAGEGGDELFGGYPTYYAHKFAPMWQLMPSALREQMLEPALNGLPVSLNNLSLDFKVKRFISAAGLPPVRRHLRWMGSIKLSEQEHLLNKEYRALATDTNEESLFDSLPLVYRNGKSNGNGHQGGFNRNAINDVVNNIMRLDMTTYLPDDLLVKSDRASMAASLEVRLPFLAYPLVEFALKMPPALKVRGTTTKYLLKKAVSPYLPDYIMKRPKKGFGIPVGKWIRQEFRPVVDELLSESFIKRQGIFNWVYINNLLAEHMSQKVDRRKELWTILMFQWWWRKFF